MPKIQTLQKALVKTAKYEKEVYRRKRRRKSFLEMMSEYYSPEYADEKQIGGLGALLWAFTPTYHNSEWEKEFQKIKQNEADQDKIIKNRRAVAYMFSGKQCCFKHYGESELSLHAAGINRMNWILNELEQLKMTQDESKPIWVDEE